MLLTGIATCTSVYTQRRRVVNPIKIHYVLQIAPLSWVSGSFVGSFVLPCFPFVVIWISAVMVWVVVTTRMPRPPAYFDATPTWWQSLTLGTTMLATIWMLISSLTIFPHSLSYFNEVAGGPLRGGQHLLHSNLDWGQDVWYVNSWLNDNPDHQPLYFATSIRFHRQLVVTDYFSPDLSPSAAELPDGFCIISPDVQHLFDGYNDPKIRREQITYIYAMSTPQSSNLKKSCPAVKPSITLKGRH